MSNGDDKSIEKELKAEIEEKDPLPPGLVDRAQAVVDLAQQIDE